MELWLVVRRVDITDIETSSVSHLLNVTVSPNERNYCHVSCCSNVKTEEAKLGESDLPYVPDIGTAIETRA